MSTILAKQKIMFNFRFSTIHIMLNQTCYSIAIKKLSYLVIEVVLKKLKVKNYYHLDQQHFSHTCWWLHTSDVFLEMDENRLEKNKQIFRVFA